MLPFIHLYLGDRGLADDHKTFLIPRYTAHSTYTDPPPKKISHRIWKNCVGDEFCWQIGGNPPIGGRLSFMHEMYNLRNI